MKRLHLILVCAALLAALSACGCASRSHAGAPGPRHPGDAQQQGALDIQLRQRTTDVVLINTSARAFGASRLWINAWYSAPIEGLAPGETLVVPLSGFRDEHGMRPQAGGFFAAREPVTIVHAQLQDDAGLFGVVVVGVGAR